MGTSMGLLSQDIWLEESGAPLVNCTLCGVPLPFLPFFTYISLTATVSDHMVA